MEDRKLTEKESIELITSMINRTKERYIGSGNMMLMWGYLILAVTVLVWILVTTTQNTAWNWLWFAIPFVGGIATPLMARSENRRRGVTTYSDVITSRLWTIFGLSEIALILMCLIPALCFAVNCWAAMLVYSLIAASFAEIVQGIIVKENSLVAGGGIGLFLGVLTLCFAVGRVTLYGDWFLPLFMLGFVCMMIIPGHILNYKMRSNEGA